MKDVGGVVEDDKDGRCSVLVAEARVLLVGEIQGLDEGEGGGGVGAVELLESGAIGARDFVDGGGVARGDEVVASVVFVDRVDVEVVPREGGTELNEGDTWSRADHPKRRLLVPRAIS